MTKPDVPPAADPGGAYCHKSALARLLGLYRLGVLDRFQPYRPSWGSHPYHYVLGPAGAAVLAAEAFEDPKRAARR